MTTHKHLKQRIRTRMRKTGETYTTARRLVLRHAPSAGAGPTRWHLPGNIPATTALRVLLAHADVKAPHSNKPFSEAMLFGIAGGIGIGIFSFFYEKENVASFFMAGRHSWHDDIAYLKNACRRLEIDTEVHESGGAVQGEKQLRDVLARRGTCIAWVDMAHLPHRAMPAEFGGGGYHVITVYSVTEGEAIIGDLTDEPIAISLSDLAKARARIKKQKHRLLSLSKSTAVPDLSAVLREGLRACYQGLGGGGWKNYRTNFSLSSIRVLADRMHGSKDKERWERIFARGGRLWRGLTWMYDCIEHYGTGGGLCRPIHAEFLSEAVDITRDGRLRTLAQQYSALGQGWSDLGRAALPEDVPAFRKACELLQRKAELTAAGGPAEEIRAVWSRLAELEKNAAERFPLSEGECSDLLVGLQERLRVLYEQEVAAHTALGKIIA